MTAPFARHALLAATLAGALSLAGCVTLPETGGPLTNHVMRTVDDKSCVAASRWGPLAITGDINASECKAIVEGLRLREAQRAKDAGRGAASMQTSTTTPKDR